MVPKVVAVYLSLYMPGVHAWCKQKQTANSYTGLIGNRSLARLVQVSGLKRQVLYV